MTFAEVIPMLLQGKKVKRPHWKIGYSILYMQLNAPYRELVDNMGFPVRLSALMFEANDWEIVK